MSEINIPPPEQGIPPSGRFPVEGPPEKGVEGPLESNPTAYLEALQSTLEEGGLTPGEVTTLQNAAHLLLSDPQLPAPDKALIDAFLVNLNKMRPISTASDAPYVCAGNAWLTNSSTVALLIASLDIINILSKIKRQEAALRITVAEVKIDTAEQVSELVESIGKYAAELCRKDAQLALIQMGLSIAEVATSGIMMYVRNAKINQKKAEIKAHNESLPEDSPDKRKWDGNELNAISLEVQSLQTATSSLSKAVGQALEAGVHFNKANLEMSKAEAEATRTLIDKLMDIMNDTMRELSTGANELSDQIKSIFGLGQSMLQALQQIFTPS